jgi:hypothetical protein
VDGREEEGGAIRGEGYKFCEGSFAKGRRGGNERKGKRIDDQEGGKEGKGVERGKKKTTEQERDLSFAPSAPIPEFTVFFFHFFFQRTCLFENYPIPVC